MNVFLGELGGIYWPAPLEDGFPSPKFFLHPAWNAQLGFVICYSGKMRKE